MEGGVWEFRPCCPRVQGCCGGPLRLYGVSLVVSAMGDEDVGGHQLIHLCGLGEVVGDGDLGGVVLGVVVWGMMPWVAHSSWGVCLIPVQLEWGVEWSRRWGLFFCFRVGGGFGFDRVLRPPGFRGPYLGGCRCCGVEEGGFVGV